MCVYKKKELLNTGIHVMTKEQYIYLFEKHQYGLCTPGEIELLKYYHDEFELKDLPWQEEMGEKPETGNEIFSNIQKDIGQIYHPVTISFWGKYKMISAVAATLIFIALGSYLFLFSNKQANTPVTKIQQHPLKYDGAPGSNKAILTLANGKTIVLDSVHNGIIANEGSTDISKLDDGSIAYNESKILTGDVMYNLLSTPRGGQYRLMLPDGSLVWLNAASSIRYPTRFSGNERDVEITGEAYFEVAKDPLRPFQVSTAGMRVQVLGTHFNINAYSDEPSVKTTLLEGVVKISTYDGSSVLKPGQQAQLSKNMGLKIFNDVDINDVVAWKNGYISFKSADIKTIMRQISRWYNIDVEYDGNITERSFTGEISRSSNLSELLKILQESNIHFKLEGKKLIVMS